MNDSQIIDYLRSRGHAELPPELTRSVMMAVATAPPARSWFSAYVPAVAVAGAAAIVAVVAILLGQANEVGPAPTPSPEPASVEALQAAVREAVGRLRESPVEGVVTAHVFGELGSATWFSWRPDGDQVVVIRTDVDVTQTGWWLDPDGEPPARGANVTTMIQVLVGDLYYRAAGEVGGDEGWTTEDRFTAPGVLGIPFPAVLDGRIDPWQDSLTPTDDGEASVQHLADGGAAWTLRMPFRSGSSVEEFEIGPDGALRAMSRELVDVEPSLEDAPFVTSVSVELAALADADPILPPDVDAPPDPTEFGLPADFPLATGAPESEIDYRAYVEDVLEALETYHWNAENVDWAAARSAALDGLPDEPTAGQAHQGVIAAIQTFDTFNTAFLRPGDVPPSVGATGSTQLPEGVRIGEVAVIALQASPGSQLDALREYLRTARAEMAAADAPEPACGWIIDVRGVSGGASGPLFSAVSGLLGEGRVITFDSAVSDWWVDVDAAGMVIFGAEGGTSELLDSPMFAEETAAAEQEQAAWVAVLEGEPPYVPNAGVPPVVVLVSNATSSAGEQLVVAFQGRPLSRTIGGVTAGSPHGLLALRMADGAQLRMPTSTPIDRDGTRYSGNIIPDDIATVTGGDGDTAIDAAVQWLESQPGCS
jgi:hypothetical protein